MGTLPDRRAGADGGWRGATVVVGDIKVDEIEAGVRDAFGALRARAAAAAQPDGTVPLHTDDLVSIVTDPEVTSSSVQILHKRPADSDALVGDYRRSIVSGLFGHMLNDRFTELARKPDAKVLGGRGYHGWLLRPQDGGT